MPRQGGIYYLPSPPSPYVSGTLAAAEDINATLSDIAVALTGSLPTDGSAAITGPLNLNGNTLTGVSTIQGASVNITGFVTAANMNITNTAAVGTLTATGYLSSGGDFAVAGNTQMNGNLNVGGAVNFGSLNTGGIDATYVQISDWASVPTLYVTANLQAQWMETANITAMGGTVWLNGQLDVTGNIFTAGNFMGQTYYVGWNQGINDFYLTGFGNARQIYWSQGEGHLLQFNTTTWNVEWWIGSQRIMRLDQAGNLYMAGTLFAELGPVAMSEDTAARDMGAPSLRQRLEALEQEVAELRARLAAPV